MLFVVVVRRLFFGVNLIWEILFWCFFNWEIGLFENFRILVVLLLLIIVNSWLLGFIVIFLMLGIWFFLWILLIICCKVNIGFVVG